MQRSNLPLALQDELDIDGFYVWPREYVHRVRRIVDRVAKQLAETEKPLSLLIAEDAEPCQDPVCLVGAVIGKGTVIGAVAGALVRERASAWDFGWTPDFKKQIDGIDRKVQGRILQAIADITDNPLGVRGDTQ